MNFTIFFLIVAIHLSAKGVSQITLSEKNAPLEKIFKAIESQSGYAFFYDYAWLNESKAISIQVKNATLAVVLKTCFKNQPLAYSIIGKTIVIKQKEELEKEIQPEIEKVINTDIGVVGTIIDETTGKPLAGATIKLLGSSVATSSDEKGNFTIQVPGVGSILVVSYVGFEEKQVTVDDVKKPLIISLLSTSSSLGNVIVAYGVQKKITVTGAISSIQTKEIKQSPAANLAVTLAGRLPGLTAIQTSGEPGRDATLLYLRGQGTINGQNPVILVDGVPRDINYIDPNEVETITILKDASATAMFGVRGANGVILVTTKRGKKGKPEINFTAESGIQSFTTVPSTVGAYDYARLRNQAGSNDGLGQNKFYSDATLQHYKLGDDPLRYPNINWPKLLMHKFTPQIRYNMNLSGGGEYVKYFINAGYLRQGGLWKVDQKNYDPSSRLDRYNFRSNIDVYLNKNKTLKAFLNVAGYVEKINSPSVLDYLPLSQRALYLLSFVYSTPPVQAGPLTPDGQVVSSGAYHSAYGAINRSGYLQETQNNVISSFGMEQDLKFITPGLSAKFMMSFDTRAIYDLNARQYYEEWQMVVDPNLYGADGKDSVYYRKSSSDVNTPLYTLTTTSFQSYSNTQLFMNYHRTFGKHTVSGLVLAQQDQRIQPGDRLPFNLRGLSSRVTYGYDNRYFAEFNAGYNGSEQFAKSHRYGFFPAVSAGWAISNEKFLKDNPVISLLKLRGSYGEVGNDQLGGQRFLYLDNISIAGGGYSQNVGRGQTINETFLGNPALSWEIAKKSNFGLDLGLFNQLNISVDIYNEKRDNMLINRQTIPALNGFPGTLPPLNQGRMTNQGYEIELNYNKSINQRLAVSVKLNFNHAKNKVEFIDEPKRTAAYAYQYRQTGYSYGQLFGYVANGFWNSQAEINNSGLTFSGIQPRPGDLKFVDVNGDKVINEKDVAPLGYTAVPQYTYGAAFSVNYKNFDISVLFQGVAKVSNYFTGWGVYENNNNIPLYRSRMLNAWTPDRVKAGLPIDFPALSTSISSSEAVNNSFFLENISYVRLKNVEIGYTLPLKWSEKIGSDKIRFYSNGLNIFTWTKMHNKDFDPELARYGTLTYPIEKVFNFGVNVVF